MSPIIANPASTLITRSVDTRRPALPGARHSTPASALVSALVFTLVSALSAAALLGVSAKATAGTVPTAPGGPSPYASNAGHSGYSGPSPRTGVTVETLARSSTAWDKTAYTAYPPGVPEPTLVRITIAPNTRLEWHTHPMPVIGYVASGLLTVQRADNGAQRTFSPGQAITELVDIPHWGWAGETGAELLVFYAREAHQPLSVATPNAGSGGSGGNDVSPDATPAGHTALD